MAKLNSKLCDELQKMEKDGEIAGERKEVWTSAMESSEKMLEKWEMALLKMQ